MYWKQQRKQSQARYHADRRYQVWKRSNCRVSQKWLIHMWHIQRVALPKIVLTWLESRRKALTVVICSDPANKQNWELKTDKCCAEIFGRTFQNRWGSFAGSSTGIGKYCLMSIIHEQAHLVGYNVRAASYKPMITKSDIATRLMWRKERWQCSIEHWFTLYRSDGRLCVWHLSGDRLLPECNMPSVKFGGGGVLLWGCFSLCGTGH